MPSNDIRIMGKRQVDIRWSQKEKGNWFDPEDKS